MPRFAEAARDGASRDVFPPKQSPDGRDGRGGPSDASTAATGAGQGAGEAGLPRGAPSRLECCWRRVALGLDKVAAGQSPSAPAVLVLEMRFEIVHRTNYRYTGPIAESSMEVRLQPMDGNGQRCLEFELELSAGITPHTYKDGFGNNVHYFNLVRPHRHLRITSRSVVETGLGPDT